MKPAVTEATVEFHVERWTVRLWIDRPDGTPLPLTEGDRYPVLLRQWLASQPDGPGMQDLALFLGETVPQLAACQVIDLETIPRQGLVVYSEWP